MIFSDEPGAGADLGWRSWLFAPADSERKMTKAAGSSADIVIIDLEDAVAQDRKAHARALCAEFLAGCPAADQRRLWVRVNPFDGPHTLADLAAVMPARPGGIMLPKARGGQDLRTLDNYLSALEVAGGIPPGQTAVIALAPETAESVHTMGTYRGVPRLAAVTWGVADLAAEIGAEAVSGADGRFGPVLETARSLCLFGAAAAGAVAVDTIHTDYRDSAGLRARCIRARQDGFGGMLAIHPDQVGIINDVFSPTEAELAAAQEIVDLFAADPAAGAIGHRGALLDRPHLTRAKALLSRQRRS
ncbi:HpcH/HpaI aldolase/citrate lyase family protein [Nocardia sp. NPDC055053]